MRIKRVCLSNPYYHVCFLQSCTTVRYIDELEDMLDENLVVLFNTETEDGSLEEVRFKF